MEGTQTAEMSAIENDDTKSNCKAEKKSLKVPYWHAFTVVFQQTKNRLKTMSLPGWKTSLITPYRMPKTLRGFVLNSPFESVKSEVAAFGDCVISAVKRRKLRVQTVVGQGGQNFEIGRASCRERV